MQEAEKFKNAELTVWPWNKPEHDRSGAHLRRKSALQAEIGACIGILLLLFSHKTIAVAALLISCVVFLSGMFAPGLYRKIEKAGKLLGAGMGQAVTWLLLAPFFYFVCGAARLMLWLRKSDPLCRKCPDHETRSYWQSYNARPDKEFYRKQF